MYYLHAYAEHGQMVRITFVLLLYTLTLACSSAAQEPVEPTVSMPTAQEPTALKPTVVVSVAQEPTAVESAPEATPSLYPTVTTTITLRGPDSNAYGVRAEILEEMDQLYPNYGLDWLILTDAPTGGSYCRSAGSVRWDENGFVSAVTFGNEQWLGAPVYQPAPVPPDHTDWADFRPAAIPLQLMTWGFISSGPVHIDEVGRLVSGAAICWSWETETVP